MTNQSPNFESPEFAKPVSHFDSLLSFSNISQYITINLFCWTGDSLVLLCFAVVYRLGLQILQCLTVSIRVWLALGVSLLRTNTDYFLFFSAWVLPSELRLFSISLFFPFFLFSHLFFYLIFFSLSILLYSVWYITLSFLFCSLF